MRVILTWQRSLITIKKDESFRKKNYSNFYTISFNCICGVYQNIFKLKYHRFKIFSSCSTDTNVVQPLTTIDGDQIRDEIAGRVEKLNAKGGTCLGAGLKLGLDVSICNCV